MPTCPIANCAAFPMSRSSDLFYLDLLWQARNSALGLVITTDNPTLVRDRFSALKTRNREDFHHISVLKTRDGRVWLLNREGKENDNAETE